MTEQPGWESPSGAPGEPAEPPPAAADAGLGGRSSRRRTAGAPRLRPAAGPAAATRPPGWRPAPGQAQRLGPAARRRYRPPPGSRRSPASSRSARSASARSSTGRSRRSARNPRLMLGLSALVAVVTPGRHGADLLGCCCTTPVTGLQLRRGHEQHAERRAASPSLPARSLAASATQLVDHAGRDPAAHRHAHRRR